MASTLSSNYYADKETPWPATAPSKQAAFHGMMPLHGSVTTLMRRASPANTHLVLATGTVVGELVSGLLCWHAGLSHM